MGWKSVEISRRLGAGLRPVEQVNFYEVQAFLERLNLRDANHPYLGLGGRWRLPSKLNGNTLHGRVMRAVGGLETRMLNWMIMVGMLVILVVPPVKLVSKNQTIGGFMT